MSTTTAVAAHPATSRYIPAALFTGALFAGFYESLFPNFGFGSGYEMASIARSIAASGTFGNPFHPFVTGPTASNPPLYPLFLAALMKICNGPSFVMVAVAVNILLNALTAALLPRVSRAFFGDPLPGVFAGVLWIFVMRLMPPWDTGFTIAAVVLFYLIAVREVERGQSGVRSGILGGILTLLNPATALIFFPWVLYLIRSRRGVRFATAVLVTVVVSNLPWMARNYQVLHSPVLRTNFGYTIYSSNNDCAEPSLYRELHNGCYHDHHPAGSASEAQLMVTLGEAQFDRLRTADTFRWIRSHGARFGQLTLARIREFWFPNPETFPRTAYAIWAVTLLSLPGIFLMARGREPVTWYTLAVWFAYPLLYYIVVSADRYRFPLLTTSLLPAGYFLARLYSFHWQGGARREHWPATTVLPPAVQGG